MKKLNLMGTLLVIVVLAFTSILMPTFAMNVAAQDGAPAVDTETPEPNTPEPTATFTSVPTNTAAPGDTATPPPTETAAPEATATLTATPNTAPPAPPQEIPEPITVVLFGTGLAALSAAVARRKRQE